MKSISQAFRLCVTLGLLFVTLAVHAEKRHTSKSYFGYVSTYTGPTSKGIYVFRFDPASGKATTPELAGETNNPSYVAIHPTGRYLYAVNEISDYKGEKDGAVSAFAIDKKTGRLTLLNQVSSRGAGPCYVSVDKTGKFVLVANYDAGSIAAFRVLKD